MTDEAVIRALVALSDDVAAAHRRFATSMRELIDDPDVGPALGPRQREVMELAWPDGGLRASDVAALIDYDIANTHAVLASLERHGMLARVPDSAPRRWTP